MNIAWIAVAAVMFISSVVLIYMLSRSRRAAHVMSLLITNVLLAVVCLHVVWPTLPINGFTLAVVSVLGVPGTAGLAFIQNYLL
ncbi:MAG: hypothetical protein RLZZ267_294 [Bacillota bacterium]|jgi:uncharacterized membrane protein